MTSFEESKTLVRGTVTSHRVHGSIAIFAVGVGLSINPLTTSVHGNAWKTNPSRTDIEWLPLNIGTYELLLHRLDSRDSFLDEQPVMNEILV